MCNSLQLSIVQKLVMSTFPHLGSGGRQGVVCMQQIPRNVDIYTVHTGHMCGVAAGDWWRHSYSCQESFTTATAAGHLALGLHSQPAPESRPRPGGYIGHNKSGSVHTFIIYHTFITLPLSIPLFVCSGNAGNSVLTSDKKVHLHHKSHAILRLIVLQKPIFTVALNTGLHGAVLNHAKQMQLI